MTTPVRTAWKAAALSMIIGVLVGTACIRTVGPARTYSAYESKAVDTAETVMSALRTAELTIDMAVRDRTFPTFVSVSLDEAEGDGTEAQSTFESIQPPNARSDRLRDQLTDLLDDATSALGDARIAARRVDHDALAAQRRPLAEAANGLEAFARDHGGHG
jgi:hypothetical protein